MYTISEDSRNEFVVKNSKFITFLKKVYTLQDVTCFLAYVKELCPKASHYCYAYRIGSEIKKASDDGEPSGTAGIPMLTVLDRENITNVLAVTVRYFGGIKLGASGLLRAYSNSIKKALDNNSICELIPAEEGVITFPYSKEKEVIQMISEKNILSKKYLECVTYRVVVPKGNMLPENFHFTHIKDTYIEKKKIDSL